MNNIHRVVITGMGAVTPLGASRELFFESLKKGRSGCRKLSLVNDSLLDCQVAAEVPDFDPLTIMEEKEIRRVPRVVPIAIAAAREALVSSGVHPGNLTLPQLQKIGVLIGTGGGGIDFAEKQYEEFFTQGSRKVTPYCISSSLVGMLSSEISINLGLHGISHVVSTGCTSSTDAIGYAYHLIRSGQEEMLLTGGAEACITQGLMAGFSRMKIVSTRFNNAPWRASRPFDRDRDGFVLGEGAWIFTLESLERAQARYAKIFGEIIGYASTCDAYHRVAVKEDALEPARAMSLALERAGVGPDAVQLIHLHGTGTRMNDTTETKAVNLAFQKHARKISTTALKSMIGHPQGACGAAGMMAAIFTLNEQFISPTINYENPDPECDLDYTPNKGLVKDVEYVLCNTIAFGSKNSALVLRRWNGSASNNQPCG